MSTLDLSPAPGAASYSGMVRSHALMEAKLLARNGEQVLLALVIPLLVLVGANAGHVVDLGAGRRIDILTPGVLALAVMSTAFTSLAISTGFERRYGVLKRIGSTPLPRSGLLLGKVLALLIVETLQIVVLSGVGLLLGWHPHGGVAAVLSCVVLIVLGTLTFAALGLLMAGSLPAEITLAAAQLVYLLLLLGGAIVVPKSSYPDAVQPVVAALPSGALADGLRTACSGGGLAWVNVVVLVVWGLAALALTVRTFRWE